MYIQTIYILNIFHVNLIYINMFIIFIYIKVFMLSINMQFDILVRLTIQKNYLSVLNISLIFGNLFDYYWLRQLIKYKINAFKAS